MLKGYHVDCKLKTLMVNVIYGAVAVALGPHRVYTQVSCFNSYLVGVLMLKRKSHVHGDLSSQAICAMPGNATRAPKQLSALVQGYQTRTPKTVHFGHH